jgi:hypothetical protein
MGRQARFLDFVSRTFEVYTNDPTYKYPGTVIESLEGANTNRIDIDLHAVPAHAGGQGAPSTAPTGHIKEPAISAFCARLGRTVHDFTRNLEQILTSVTPELRARLAQS